ENVRNYVMDKISKKQKIMGMGHRVYKTKDPRANILQKLARQLFKDGNNEKLLQIAEELEKVCLEILAPKGIFPNVDFYSGLVYRKMGIKADLHTCVFAAARVAGWMAHWTEQREDNRIFRPSQIYEGNHDQAYLPIDKR
ncbi:MAG: citrate synthase, partial [Bdellovibrionales bacterium]|nr:citrate synthase [Bdellovibrionales bacterium]